MPAYRCSLCQAQVPAGDCVTHTDWHRLQPDWGHVINFWLVEA